MERTELLGMMTTLKLYEADPESIRNGPSNHYNDLVVDDAASRLPTIAGDRRGVA